MAAVAFGTCFLALVTAIGLWGDGFTPVKFGIVVSQGGHVQLSWSAPGNAEQNAEYRIVYSADLKEWMEVVDPVIEFEGGMAIWEDDGTLTGGLIDSDTPRFYRIWERPLVDLSDRIERRFGEGPIPLAVQYTTVLEPFEASEAAMARYQERYELSVKQELSYVLGQYLVLFEDVFPFKIDRGEGVPSQQVTEDGVALQQLAEELVAAHNGELLVVWEGVIQGFGAYLPPPAVEAIRDHSFVKLFNGEGIGSYTQGSPPQP